MCENLLENINIKRLKKEQFNEYKNEIEEYSSS